MIQRRVIKSARGLNKNKVCIFKNCFANKLEIVPRTPYIRITATEILATFIRCFSFERCAFQPRLTAPQQH